MTGEQILEEYRNQDQLLETFVSLEEMIDKYLPTWQPIETAPKDGRTILLWLGGEWQEPRLASWYEPWKVWLNAGDEPITPNVEPYGIGSKIPTHWMPTPGKPVE